MGWVGLRGCKEEDERPLHGSLRDAVFVVMKLGISRKSNLIVTFSDAFPGKSKNGGL